FAEMAYSENPRTLNEWIPLMMKSRHLNEKIAATHVASGTDVNFGALTRKLIHHLETENKVNVLYNRTVTDINRLRRGAWEVDVKYESDNGVEHLRRACGCIGVGRNAGAALQHRGLPESKEVGGLPSRCAWIMCANKEIVNEHGAEVYGR